MKPTLHLIGLFHTKCTPEYSHCAFTGKVHRFPKMMHFAGYNVIEYSNEGSESEADEHVIILNREEFAGFFSDRKKTDFHGDCAYVGSPAHTLFEQKLIPEMRKRVKPEDIICHPFGHAHSVLLSEFPGNQHVETGIGYPTLMDGSFRIFESNAWMHYHQGKANRSGANYEWVIPNYFDVTEWEPSYKAGDYIAFLGRICSVKGMDTVLEIARRSPYPIKIAGQGDPSPWKHANIEYVGPLMGTERSDFLRNARCAIMPTVFTEPFGGSGVEAMLCGTPLIAVDYGAFTETVIQGKTGFRCKTLQDWLTAIEKVEELDRKEVARVARERYSLEACAEKYDSVFQTLNDLHRKGWYSCDDVSYSAELSRLADRDITFLAIGAMDGKSHDALYEHAHKNKHWAGILVEPVLDHFDALKANYENRTNLEFENVAICEEVGEREIHRVLNESGDLPEWVDGISTFYPDGGAFAQFADKAVKETVKCTTLRKLLKKHKNLGLIDVVQIDAEGCDYNIFKQMWDCGIAPYLLYIEVVRMSTRDQKDLRQKLYSAGYSVKREGDNWLAIYQDEYPFA